MSVSNELTAMRVVADHLGPLDQHERDRVLAFFIDKYVEQPKRDREQMARILRALPRTTRPVRRVLRDLRAGKLDLG